MKLIEETTQWLNDARKSVEELGFQKDPVVSNEEAEAKK